MLEVGLGGRLDATTTHPQRSVLALASIGLDHTEHLGPTLAAIAAEKAGVMHPGAIAISGPQAPEVRAVLEQQAAQRGCSLRWVAPLPPASSGGPQLGLAGDLQRQNAAVAAAAAEGLAQQGWPIDAGAIQRGLAAARWPGRLEQRRFGGLPLLVDGAHNPPAAVALRQELDQLAQARGSQLPRRWLLGIQRHKQAPALLGALLRPGDAVRVLPLPEHPSWDAAALAADLPGNLAAQVSLEDAPAGDLSEQLTWLVDSPALPVLAGSLYLVAAVLPLLEPTD